MNIVHLEHFAKHTFDFFKLHYFDEKAEKFPGLGKGKNKIGIRVEDNEATVFSTKDDSIIMVFPTVASDGLYDIVVAPGVANGKMSVSFSADSNESAAFTMITDIPEMGHKGGPGKTPLKDEVNRF